MLRPTISACRASPSRTESIPEFGQEQGTSAGEVLEAPEIASELFDAVQVHVEGEEIEARDLEVLGHREVGVGYQRLGVDLLDLVCERAQESPDAGRLVPADHVRRDLVPDEEGEQGPRRVAQGAGGVPHAAPDLPSFGAGIEEAEMLRPRDSDQEP